MVTLIIKENGQILLGELINEDSLELDYLLLKNVYIINLVQNEQGALTPVPIAYPHPYLSAFVIKKALDREEKYKFFKNDIVYYLEKDINQQTLNLYEELRAAKSGIQIAKTMPNKNESNIILN